MRVFISHQHADSTLAAQLAARLRVVHQIESYVDVIDPTIARGEDLANHIRSRMSGCTQLLAVISYSTRESQWVPWEIGVATEKDFPLATFSSTHSKPPEFLQKWPYLRTQDELDQYARASKSSRMIFESYKSLKSEAEARREGANSFYRALRTSLRQF